MAHNSQGGAETALRVSPVQARELMAQGAMLVAAYRNGPGFKANYLEGAVAYDDFIADLARVPKERGLIFY